MCGCYCAFFLRFLHPSPFPYTSQYKSPQFFVKGEKPKKGELVNFHSKCKILGGVTEFFGKAFLCRFPPGNLPRPVVYSVHSLPI